MAPLLPFEILELSCSNQTDRDITQTSSLPLQLLRPFLPTRAKGITCIAWRRDRVCYTFPPLHPPLLHDHLSFATAPPFLDHDSAPLRPLRIPYPVRSLFYLPTASLFSPPEANLNPLTPLDTSLSTSAVSCKALAISPPGSLPAEANTSSISMALAQRLTLERSLGFQNSFR